MNHLNRFLVALFALGIVASQTGCWYLMAQQEEERRQQERAAQQEERIRSEFFQMKDSLRSTYTGQHQRLELIQAEVAGWMQRMASNTQAVSSPEYAALNKVQEATKEQLADMEKTHGELTAWAATITKPTVDDLRRLTTTYSSLNSNAAHLHGSYEQMRVRQTNIERSYKK